MAQIHTVRIPTGPVFDGPVRLGQPPAAPARRAPRLTVGEGLALTSLAGGLLSAFGVYLFATNRKQEAYALAIASGVSTAFIAAARLLGDSTDIG